MLTRPVGATSPPITDTLLEDGEPLDLTLYSNARFSIRAITAGTAFVNLDGATIADAATGMVEYTPDATTVNTAGAYAYWWTLTDPAAETWVSPETLLTLVGDTATTGLCSLYDVKLDLGITQNDQDAVLTSLITSATGAIEAWTGRQFTSAGAGTKCFDIAPRGLVDFAPYDLASSGTKTVNLVSIQGQGTATLTSDQYQFRPLTPRDGVYRSVRVFWPPYGYSAQITGSWGFATIPAAVAQAARVTVREWYRSAQTIPVSDLDGSVSGGITDIPYGAQRLLAPYRRATA